MTTKEWKKIRLNWLSLTDTLRWKFLVNNSKDLGLVVNLYNDDTFVTHQDIEDEGNDDHFLDFDNYEGIGNANGLVSLLDAVNIKWEEV